MLAHQSGLIAIDQPLGVQELADHDALAEILARQKPAWPPGMKHGYHTLTLGWYQSELIRRVDPQRRSLGAFFRDEVAAPLQAEFYIGLPSHIDEQRLARTKGFHRLALLWHLNELPLGMVLSGIWPQSLVARSVNTLRLQNPADIGNLELRGMEIPSANGIGEARAIARIYGSLATGGQELGITPRTWQELIAPATPPQLGSRDAILKMDTRYSFGFSRPSRAMQFGSGPSRVRLSRRWWFLWDGRPRRTAWLRLRHEQDGISDLRRRARKGGPGRLLPMSSRVAAQRPASGLSGCISKTPPGNRRLMLM